MKNKLKLAITIFAILGVSFLVLAACAPRQGTEPPPTDQVGDDFDLAEASYVGMQSCVGCHNQINAEYSQTFHPRKVGPKETIRQEAIDQWNEVLQFDQRGNPVVYDENEATGIAGARQINLTDGTQLADVDGVFVRHEGNRQFIADFYNTGGQVVHTMEVDLYHVGGGKYRQAFGVNLGEGEGTRLLKYQFSFDDYQYQNVWRDRNQARIFEINCIGCHVTGFNLEAWEQDRDQPLEAVTANLGVGCENCHGPGSIHVTNSTVAGTIVNPANLTKDQQVHNCSQCHIRGTSTSHPGRQDNLNFRPGDNVLDNFNPMPVTWDTATNRVAGDGKARASRQQFMDHYIGVKSDMRCTDCHSWHGYNEQGELFLAELSELCAGCHGDQYGTADDIRQLIDGRRGWEGTENVGWRMQHTYRIDEQGRVMGLPEGERPEDNVWPWELDDWQWDFDQQTNQNR